ncbi:asparaginase [Brevibacterium album]|uniref:asparaginase n=1 Tax=Brevibacterium album TaxID=417948 RepID=UPI000404A6C2|nr:asparaginase [Brevibacterium album]
MTGAQVNGTEVNGAQVNGARAHTAGPGAAQLPRAAQTFTAAQTLTAQQAVELAVVERSGFVESRHLGAAVLMDPDGTVVCRLGAVEAPVFVRSALKPLQAVASLRAGARVEGASAALATASHRSEQRHIDTVEAMLASAGLDESALRCPASPPAHGATRFARREAGHELSRLHFNCSGKHAAFLMAAVAGGHTTEDYLAPDHPVQREVARVVEEFAGAPSAAVGTDGCGAPVHALPLTGLARAIGRFARGESPETRTLMDGVLAHPWGIQGEGRSNTVVIERLGIFAKGGAEGVLVLATPEGWSLALKCLDGSDRPAELAGLNLLAAAGAVDPQAAAEALVAVVPAVTGGSGEGGATVRAGAVHPGAGLVEALDVLGAKPLGAKPLGVPGGWAR